MKQQIPLYIEGEEYNGRSDFNLRVGRLGLKIRGRHVPVNSEDESHGGEEI